MRSNVAILLILLILLFGIPALIMAIFSTVQSNNNASEQTLLKESVESIESDLAALNGNVSSLETDFATLQTNITQITQVNNTQTGASIVFTSADTAILFHVNRTFSYNFPVLNFTFVRYNDNNLYWFPNEPFRLFVPVTGRYALSASCTTVFAEVIGYTCLHGFLSITYCPPEGTDCPDDLAGALVLPKSTIDGLGAETGYNISPVSMYVETELTGGNGEWIGLVLRAAYNPALTSADTPVDSSHDSCEMAIRYLGPSTGTPWVTHVCTKKKEKKH